MPRKPLFTFEPPDGGDVAGPRWTPDGKSILYTHKQPDRDGFLHHDLFRWTPATGRIERITHLADVQDADPLPEGVRAVAVRNGDGASQLVIVDTIRGAIEPMNAPSLDIVYSHPRASRDGRIAWAEHRAGAWRVVVDGKPLPLGGAFAPEWGSDGALFFAAAGRGFIDIARAEGPVTRTSGAALDPAPSPDGSLYFMSLEPDGFVVRHVTHLNVERVLNASAPRDPATQQPSNPATDDRSYVPALPPAPARPVAFRSDPVEARPYGIGRQEMSTLFGGAHTAFGDSYEFGLRFGDVVGRLDTLLIGGTRGAALATAWRGWPVEASAHLFRVRRERGAELRGRWEAVLPQSRIALSAGGLANGGSRRAFGDARYELRQRRLAFEEVAIAGDSAQHLRGSVRGALRFGSLVVSGVLTRARRASVGGVASSMEPDSLLLARILDPALDRDTLAAERYRGERLELQAGALTAFWQRHRADRTVDVVGLETAIAGPPMPLVKAAAVELIVGVARVRPERKTRAWIALRWQP